jgi:hypothetical protein
MLNLGCLGKLLALPLLALFIMFLPIAIWVYNLNQVGLQEETYLAAFEKNDFYANIAPLILPALAEATRNNIVEEDIPTEGRLLLQFSRIVANLKAEDWASVTEQVLPPEYLRGQIEPNLTNFLAYLRGEAPRLRVVFETQTISQALRGPAGDDLVARIYDSWDTCSPLQENQWQAYLQDNSQPLPTCQSSDETRAVAIRAALRDIVDDLARRLPPTWDIRQEYARDNRLTMREVDANFYRVLQRPAVLARETFLVNFLLTLVLLAFIIIITVDSARSFCRWIGWGTALAGLLTLLPLGGLPLLLSATPTPPSGEDNISLLQWEALRGVALSLVSKFSEPLLLQGAMVTLIGFGLLFLSFLVPSLDERLGLHP